MWAAPWMSWIATGGAATVKLQLGLASTVSGGAIVSWSEIWAPVNVTVQVSPGAKSTAGSSRNAVGPFVTTAECAPLGVQTIENHDPAGSTRSLKVMPTFASTATFPSLVPGVWLASVGARSDTTGVTFTEYESVPVRSRSSTTLQAPTFGPAVVAGGIVNRREKTRSLGVASPFVPSSNRSAVPSSAKVRSHVTEKLVLVGFVPGATAAVTVTSVPGAGLAGVVATAMRGEPARDTDVFLGVGAPAVKSALLLSVSVHPPFLRSAAAVAEIVGAWPVPSKKFAPLEPVPYPTRSTIDAS